MLVHERPRKGSDFEFWVSCHNGLEQLCSEEIRQQGPVRVSPESGGVTFFGSLYQAYRVCLWVRTAMRVCFVLNRSDGVDSRSLETACGCVAWDEHLAATGSFDVVIDGRPCDPRQVSSYRQVVERSVQGYFRERCYQLPRVEPLSPDIQIVVVRKRKSSVVGVSLSGSPLGFRNRFAIRTDATIAAGLLLATEWANAKHDNQMTLLFSDDGVFAHEACMIASNFPPNIFRLKWGFQYWRRHDEETWQKVLDEAYQALEGKVSSANRITSLSSSLEALDATRKALEKTQSAHCVKLDLLGAKSLQLSIKNGDTLFFILPTEGQSAMEKWLKTVSSLIAPKSIVYFVSSVCLQLVSEKMLVEEQLSITLPKNRKLYLYRNLW